MNDRRYRSGAILLLLAAISCSAPAFAEPSSNQINMARAMTLEGREKLNAGDPAAALKLFHSAHEIMHSTVTGLDVAKAELALGQLIEARDMALEVTRSPVGPRESNTVKDARSAAAQLATDLASRIPSVAVRVVGPQSAVAAVSVRLDGAQIPVAAAPPPQQQGNPAKKGEAAAAVVSSPREVNPGQHLVEVSASGYVNERRPITLAAGQHPVVELKLSPIAPVPPSPSALAQITVPRGPQAIPVPPPEIRSVPAPVVQAFAPPPERPWQRPLAFAAMSLAAAGLGVSAGLGGGAIAKNNESNDGHCNGRECSDQIGFDLRKQALALAHGSTATAIAGNIFAAGGLVLLFTAPSSPVQKATGKAAGAMHAASLVEITPGAIQIRGSW